MTADEMMEVFIEKNFNLGRMISGSKSGYYHQYPENDVVFNANIIVESKGKIWHGDLDITRDFDDLSDIKEKIGEPLYILREHDARFGSEDDKVDDLMKRAHVKIS